MERDIQIFKKRERFTYLKRGKSKDFHRSYLVYKPNRMSVEAFRERIWQLAKHSQKVQTLGRYGNMETYDGFRSRP